MLLEEVCTCLRNLSGVGKIRVRPLTGSVLIHYNPKALSFETILSKLQECGYLDVATAHTLDSRIRDSVVRAGDYVSRACLNMVVDHSLKQSGLSFLSVLL